MKALSPVHGLFIGSALLDYELERATHQHDTCSHHTLLVYSNAANFVVMHKGVSEAHHAFARTVCEWSNTDRQSNRVEPCVFLFAVVTSRYVYNVHGIRTARLMHDKADAARRECIWVYIEVRSYDATRP